MTSRFHVELNSIKVEDMSAKFNIFGDSLDQVTADLEAVIAYVTGQQARLPAQPVLQATIIPSVAPRMQAQKPARQIPQAPAKPSVQADICCACGSDSLEWVSGTRKDNGKSFAAFKCQECGKWQPEAKP